MSNYTMLSIYGRVRVSLKLEASWEIFSRMAPEANRFNSFLRILENAISLEKTNKRKSNKSLFESLLKNTWKYMELKYLDQLRKKTSVVSSWSRSHSPSHSPIDKCGLFIRLEEYKSQATSYKYRLCSHSLQQSRRQYSFFSRSAKTAGGFKQLHKKRPR